MVRLYFKYLGMMIKSQLEYRKTFILLAFSQMFSSFTCLAAIYFMFDKFGNINGYKFEEVIICFIVSFFAFSIVECLFRGLDKFEDIISDGTFDRILTRPRPILFQVVSSRIEISKVGRMALSIVALIAVLANQPQLLQWDKLLTIFNMIFGTCILYSSIFIIRAGICFYTTQGLEIMNIFTDGVRDLTQYPLDIYGETVKKIFTFVIPAALVNYYPFIYLIGRDTNIINMFCPLFVVILLIPSLMFWKIGVRKYRSVGS